MSKLIFFLFAAFFAFFLVITSPLCADEYSEAMKRAQKEHKHVVIFFYSRFCPYCDDMERYVLSDKEVRGLLQNWVVFIRIDTDKNRRLANAYGVWSYPTLWFLDPDGKPIVKVPGYVSKNDFKKMLVFVKGRHYTSMTLREFLDM